jgi:hypothetical protein
MGIKELINIYSPITILLRQSEHYNQIHIHTITHKHTHTHTSRLSTPADQKKDKTGSTSSEDVGTQIFIVHSHK